MQICLQAPLLSYSVFISEMSVCNNTTRQFEPSKAHLTQCEHFEGTSCISFQRCVQVVQPTYTIVKYPRSWSQRLHKA